MKGSDALTVMATGLDKLKLKNPFSFVGIIGVCYFAIFLINHPEELTNLTGIQVTPTIEYIRDFILMPYMGLSSSSTFNYLASSNPKKVAALGDADPETKTIL